jgi:hypothetical protein
MPTENRSSNTEMVSELRPCPFCSAAMRVESNRDWHRVMGDHTEECVFTDSETMMVPATDAQRSIMVADWNRRAQPAEQCQGALLQQAKHVVEHARAIDREAFSKGAQSVEPGLFRGLAALLDQYDAALSASADPSALIADPCRWSDQQVMDFIGVALRNVDLQGEVRLSEIRQGFQFMRDRGAL